MKKHVCDERECCRICEREIGACALCNRRDYRAKQREAMARDLRLPRWESTLGALSNLPIPRIATAVTQAAIVEPKPDTVQPLARRVAPTIEYITAREPIPQRTGSTRYAGMPHRAKQTAITAWETTRPLEYCKRHSRYESGTPQTIAYCPWLDRVTMRWRDDLSKKDVPLAVALRSLSERTANATRYGNVLGNKALKAMGL